MLFASLALLLSKPFLFGAQERQPSFPAQSELVLVDALVLDDKGNPVEGLTQDEFSVREEGVAVPIVRFEAVHLEEAAPSEAPTARFVSSNAAPPQAPRSFVIVFDDAQLTRASGQRARAALIQFLQTGLRENDDVTLVATATQLWWSTRLGSGRRDLLSLVQRLEGRRVADASGGRISDYEAMRLYLNRDRQVGAQVIRRFYEGGIVLDPPNQAAAESRQQLDLGEGHPLVRVKAAEVYQNAKSRNLATLRTLERVARALSQGTGRKAVLLVSDGFVYDRTLPEFRDVVAALSRANGALYFLDARGLPGTADFAAAEYGRATEERDVQTLLGQAQLETEGAQSVAADTGGDSFRNPNDIAGGLERIARQSRAYYLLGYVSPSNRRDGKFRKIQVDVKRSGLQVRARKGYYAASDATQARGQTDLDPALRQALDSPFAAGAIPLRLAGYTLGPAQGAKTAVLIAADIDPSGVEFRTAEGREQARLDSYLVVTPRDGGERPVQEKAIELSLPPELRQRLAQTWIPVYRNVELEAGVHQVRFLVRDAKSGRIGTVRHQLEVPPSRKLRLSTPILTDSLQADPSGGSPRPIPLARRTFFSGTHLAYLFEVYGAARDASGAPRVTSRHEVRRADGSRLAGSESTPIEPTPQGQLARQVALSLRDVPPGDYEIVLTVRDEVAGRTLELRDAFSVSSRPAAASGRP